MTISLPPELESIVSRKIADGSFQSEEEVVRAALELLVSGEEEETERLRTRGRQLGGSREASTGLMPIVQLLQVKTVVKA